MGKVHKFQIIELFGPTIQGEGIMTGTVTHFLRFGGCGLRCSWCDSMYAVEPSEILKHRVMMTQTDIVEGLKSLAPAPYVTFTGGDPAIQEEVAPLVYQLNIAGMKVAIETQGQHFPDWLEVCDVLTFSPKGPSSGNIVDIRDLYLFLQNWMFSRPFRVCIKVVVFDEADFKYAMEVYDEIPPVMYDAFYFTAGTMMDVETPLERIAKVLQLEKALAHQMLSATQTGTKFNDRVHIGCQKHVLLWPEEEKGV